MFLDLAPEQFLQRYWQKRPLLLRKALPNFQPPLQGDDLAGLACEPDVESRLVAGCIDSTWRVEHGPLGPERFEQLPEAKWTLLVQDVDKFVPEVAELLEPLAFLPQWRIDDVMVSYSAPGGSVGPHTDRYDVFLIQGQGRRRWQWSEQFAPQLRENCDLKMLANFVPEHDEVLEPGDILYLPPHVAHYGVALEPGLTFSLGFRSPDQRQLMMDLAEGVAERGRSEMGLTDAGRTIASQPTLLALEDRKQFRAMLRSGLEWNDAQLDLLIARHLTCPKEHLVPEEGLSTTLETLRARWQSGDRPQPDPRSRFAHYESGDSILLFANGVEHVINAHTFDRLEPYLNGASSRHSQPGHCEPAHHGVRNSDPLSRDFETVLLTLLKNGSLQWTSETLYSTAKE